MKKIYLSLMAIAFAGATFAQSQRLVVFEEFTQASCPPCSATNPGLNALLNANDGKVVSIKYQTSWPGSDPMNAHNPTEVATRVTYYAVTGVPNGQLDGKAGFSGQPAGLTQAMIDTRYNTTSPLVMTVTHSLSATNDTIFVHAVVTKTGTITSTNLKVRFAVIERNVHFASPPGTNGEKDFEGVMKKMLPNATGTDLVTPNVGDSMEFDFSWKLANVYSNSQLAVVGFVQDDAGATKPILQGGYSAPILDCNIEPTIAGGFTCSSTYTPSFDLTNSGQTDITSCDISYKINGGATQTYNWSGMIAMGSTATFALPAVTLNNGNNSISATVTMINTVAAANTANHVNSLSIPAALITFPAPITQNYAPVTWPPVDWSIFSPDNTNWIRSTASTGSAKCDFFNVSAGTFNMVMPKADLTPTAGQTAATLDFDLAHADYSAAYIDECKVLVSTDCGATWTEIWNQSGTALNSVATLYTGAFTPTTAQWKHVWVDMTPYLNMNNVLVNFQGLSGFSNNLYIDNVNLHFGAPTGIADLGAGEYLKMYPNPTSGLLNVDAKFASTKSLTVTVTDMLGNVVYANQFAKAAAQRFTIDLTNQTNGSYFVKFENENGIDVQKINIMK